MPAPGPLTAPAETPGRFIFQLGYTRLETRGNSSLKLGAPRAVTLAMQRIAATLLILLALVLGIRWLRDPAIAPATDASASTPVTPERIAPSPALEPIATTREPAPTPLREPEAPATKLEPGIVGEWTGRPPVLLVEFGDKHARHSPEASWRLPVRLSAGRLVYLSFKTYQPTELDGGVFTGTVENHPGSTAVMSYVGASQAGVVLIPGEHRAFNFRSGDDGILRVTELDTLNAPDCGAGS